MIGPFQSAYVNIQLFGFSQWFLPLPLRLAGLDSFVTEVRAFSSYLKPSIQLNKTTMGACAFDKLFSINVPLILEKIFFHLDYDSFQQCLRVNKAWTELISSDLYLEKAKSMFEEDILEAQEKLWQWSFRGNIKEVKSCLKNCL